MSKINPIRQVLPHTAGKIASPLWQALRDVYGVRNVSSKGTRCFLALLLPLTLGACSALGGGDAPAQKEPARLDIAIRADADLNQDIKGRGAPMLLRVYELKSEVAFQDADFFALQNTDKAALGADLLAVDQYIIRPGETRQILRKSNPETVAIGIFAAYRDLPNATWRVVHKMPLAAEKSWLQMVMPANKARLKIDLQANAVLMTDQDAGKNPVQFANESIKGLQSNALDDAKQSVEGAAQKAGESIQSVPKAASMDRLRQWVKPQP